MKSSYAYLLAPFLGWLLAQVVKNILRLFSQKGSISKKLFSSGDMPSAHTATVVALATVIFAHEGVSSLFAVASVLASVTIYDALVARRSIGEQGTALLRLLEKSPFAKEKLPRVALGHKPLEVLAGGVLGGVIGLIVAIFITF